MIDFSTMKDSIYDWVNGVTSRECIYAFQNAPVPNKPFYSLRLLSFVQQGNSSVVPIENQTVAGEYDYITTVDFILEILGFGPGIVQDTVKLQMSLNDPTVHDNLLSGGVISWNNMNPVLDISGVDNDENEERSSFDVGMRTANIEADVLLGIIEIVNIEATYQQPGKPDIIHQLNIDSTI